VGLPKQNRAKLLEPYVTTRAKGTGLGLAIVQKIVEQHRGTLTLEDAPLAPDRQRGAMMRMTLPMPPMEEYRPAPPPEPKPVENSSNDASLQHVQSDGQQDSGVEPLPKPTSLLTTPSVSPTLLKNSDRVMPRPAGKPAGRIQGAR
jgi:cell division protein FtsN